METCIYSYVHLSISNIRLPFYLYVCMYLSICLSVCLSVHVYLSIFLFLSPKKVVK